MPKKLHENGPDMPSGLVLDQMRGALKDTKIETKVPRPSGGFGGRRGGTGHMKARPR